MDADRALGGWNADKLSGAEQGLAQDGKANH